MKQEVSDDKAKEYAKSINAIWGITSATVDKKGFVNYLNRLIHEYMKKFNLNNAQDFVDAGISKRTIKISKQIVKTKKNCCGKKKRTIELGNKEIFLDN